MHRRPIGSRVGSAAHIHRKFQKCFCADKETSVRIVLRSVPTRVSGWRIGKSVRYRHCPRNGNGVQSAAYTTGWTLIREGAAAIRIRFGSLQSPETSLTQVPRWVAAGDRQRNFRRYHIRECRPRTVHTPGLSARTDAFGHGSKHDPAHSMVRESARAPVWPLHLHRDRHDDRDETRQGCRSAGARSAERGGCSRTSIAGAGLRGLASVGAARRRSLRSCPRADRAN
jgi:hypothetical protein